ncbi:hypothetical protein GUITHDRAFT_101846 [Guillardia theta CCMP2712]|uniref:Uncharacterized protein n=1 Tax=Guillardia theta (strain CCMP2712) TaxID=905079 RepID=L1JX58_GUITC|nr:hypothetical protein GUITHDRAFT_101846 [Guillardia theta CCMP2712]EKX52688.1 hypothetical protein GUITHDRAFT_101846 [Guillardia theta CCMP2712]|eukprot:XP_005839668.1 hypothetical protein GUITHDRAFT_101846 [Guillardia theta CCMP2712]
MSSGYEEPEKLMRNHLEFQKLLDQISEQTEISQATSPSRDLRTPGPSEKSSLELGRGHFERSRLHRSDPGHRAFPDGQNLAVQSEIDMLRNIQAARSTFSEQRKAMNDSSWKNETNRRPLNEGSNGNGYVGMEKETQLYTELGYLVQERDILIKERNALQVILNRASDEIKHLVSGEQRHVEELKSWVKQRDQLNRDKIQLEVRASDDADVIRTMLANKSEAERRADSYMREIENLKSKVEEKTNELSKSHSSKESLAQKISNLEDTIGWKDKEINRLEDEVCRLRSDCASAFQGKVDIQDASDAYRELERERDSLLLQLAADREGRIQEMTEDQNERNRLTMELRNAQEELHRVVDANHGMQSVIQEKDEIIARMSQDLESFQTHVSYLEGKVKEQEYEIFATKEELMGVHNENHNNYEKCSCLLQDLARAKEQISSIKSEKERLEKEMRKFSAERDEWAAHQAFLLDNVIASSSSSHRQTSKASPPSSSWKESPKEDDTFHVERSSSKSSLPPPREVQRPSPVTSRSLAVQQELHNRSRKMQALSTQAEYLRGLVERCEANPSSYAASELLLQTHRTLVELDRNTAAEKSNLQEAQAKVKEVTLSEATDVLSVAWRAMALPISHCCTDEDLQSKCLALLTSLQERWNI